MIDWHSHILPKMDDGSKDVAESLTLVETLKRQGIDTIVASPHFYANDESVETFIKRRSESYQRLHEQLPECSPAIRLGAEVRYYPGISRMADLKQLKIEGSNLLLLEMPISKWTEYTVRELIELSSLQDINLILAHIERYLTLQTSEVQHRLYESGILMQVNASFFVKVTSKRKAIDYLSSGKIHFLGSDCHNMTTRPPELDKAFAYIRKKLGNDFISQMDEYGSSMFVQNK